MAQHRWNASKPETALRSIRQAELFQVLAHAVHELRRKHHRLLDLGRRKVGVDLHQMIERRLRFVQMPGARQR